MLCCFLLVLSQVLLLTIFLLLLQFVLLLWAVSHVASWCSASCAIITVFVLSFTVPRIYSEFKKDIDPVLAKGCHAVCDVTKTVSTKVTTNTCTFVCLVLTIL